jgi:hypothetical protein
MKITRLLIALPMLLFACSKHDGAPVASPAGAGDNSQNQPAAVKPSSITVLIDGTPIPVTSVDFSRTDGSLHFSAGNQLQRVDGYCFWFYGTSGFNYQYSDSLNYSTRPDSLSAWDTRRAISYGDVCFDCCSFPVKDSVVDGRYSGKFGSSGKEPGLTVSGVFHLLYCGGQACRP